MSRNKSNAYHAAKKKVKLEKLVEKYYGKNDILASWLEREDLDHDYIRDLKARVRTHRNDLIYRGHDDVSHLPLQH
jgi:CTP:phosphocholine cytidylyltransferase-like protein